MRIYFRVAIGLICFLLISSSFSSGWHQLKSEHFIVYYTGDYQSFARETLTTAEENYVAIAEYLGYARLSNFWTWQNRVKIYIYPNQESYFAGTNQPSWSKGMADYLTKTISSFVRSQRFLDYLLPHEMAHLMFRDFVGFPAEGGSASGGKGIIPLWLDEGVAQCAEVKKRAKALVLIRQQFTRNRILSLDDMIKLDIRKIESSDNISVNCISREGDKFKASFSGGELVNFYYLQSFSLVTFLIDKFGNEKFTVFCRSLRDGKNLAEALRSAYPHSFRSLDDLEGGWLDYIRTR